MTQHVPRGQKGEYRKWGPPPQRLRRSQIDRAERRKVFIRQDQATPVFWLYAIFLGQKLWSLR